MQFYRSHRASSLCIYSWRWVSGLWGRGDISAKIQKVNLLNRGSQGRGVLQHRPEQPESRACPITSGPTRTPAQAQQPDTRRDTLSPRQTAKGTVSLELFCHIHRVQGPGQLAEDIPYSFLHEDISIVRLASHPMLVFKGARPTLGQPEECGIRASCDAEGGAEL